MVLYEGGEDIKVKENTSSTYYTGSVHKTNNFGNVTVLAQVDKYYLACSRGKPYRSYCYAIVMFEDSTKVQVSMGHLCSGNVKNPNHPSVLGIGFIGQGVYACDTHPKERAIWEDMLHRCYLPKSLKSHPTYRGCVVTERWHNFQNFCEDIQHLEGYAEWKNNKNRKNVYQLDKDIKIKGNKIYHPDFCMFVLWKDNMSRYNKKQALTGLTYLAIRIKDNYREEFTNQAEFSEKYKIEKNSLCQCCIGNYKTAGGWVIQVKESVGGKDAKSK